MEKELLIKGICEMLKATDDTELIHLIYMILWKSELQSEKEG